MPNPVRLIQTLISIKQTKKNPKILQNRHKFSGIFRNCTKISPKLSKILENLPKLSKILRYYQKSFEIAKILQIIVIDTHKSSKCRPKSSQIIIHPSKYRLKYLKNRPKLSKYQIILRNRSKILQVIVINAQKSTKYRPKYLEIFLLRQSVAESRPIS